MTRSTNSSVSNERLQKLRERLARQDPELLEAAAEVDRALLRWMLSLSPLQRLEAASSAARGLAGFTHVKTRSG